MSLVMEMADFWMAGQWLSVASGYNPFPLGKLVPGSTYATASIAISNNVPGLSGYIYGLAIRALSTNNGKIYICNSASNPNESTYANVIDILAAGSEYSVTSGANNTMPLSQFYIGADNSTDAAVGYFFQR